MEKSYVKTPAEIAAIETEALNWFWEREGLKEAKKFHHQNGVWFLRNGSDVRILKILCRQETTSVEYSAFNCEVQILFDCNVSASSWASIISFLSKGGESLDSYQKILEFHGIS